MLVTMSIVASKNGNDKDIRMCPALLADRARKSGRRASVRRRRAHATAFGQLKADSGLRLPLLFLLVRIVSIVFLMLPVIIIPIVLFLLLNRVIVIVLFILLVIFISIVLSILLLIIVAIVLSILLIIIISIGLLILLDLSTSIVLFSLLLIIASIVLCILLFIIILLLYAAISRKLAAASTPCASGFSGYNIMRWQEP